MRTAWYVRFRRCSDNPLLSTNYHAFQEKSRHKSDLESMLRAFNIFVDTPCCILTQEESKRLIHGSAKEKYDFFLKATGLKMIHEELSQAEARVQEALERKEALLPTVERAKQHRNECKQRLEEFLQLDHFQARIREETAKVYWLDVRFDEEVVQKVQDAVLDKQEAVEAAKEALQASTLEDLDRQLKELNAETDRLNEAKEPVDVQYAGKHEAYRQLQHQESRIRTTVKSHEKERKTRQDRVKVVTAEVNQQLMSCTVAL
jgi:chromosome segregation ATPase